jgi:hypothetical protein
LLTPSMTSLKASLYRTPLVLLLSLLVLTRAQADVPRWQGVVEALGEHAIANQTNTINKYLDIIDFGRALRSSIAQFDAQPVIVQIEHVYWYAEAGRRGSGQDALAMLARAIANDYDTLHSNSEVAELFKATKSPTDALQFRRPDAAKAALPSKYQRAILSFSHHVADGNHVTAELLLRKAGASAEQIYKALRSSGDVREAIGSYVASLGSDTLREQKIKIMVNYVIELYPSAGEDPRLWGYIDPSMRVDPGKPPKIRKPPGTTRVKSPEVDDAKSLSDWLKRACRNRSP